MLLTWLSLNSLAFFAVFARKAAAVPNSSTGVIIEGLPAPTAKVDFKYSFKYVFKGGKCSASQQTDIVNTLYGIATMVERTTLWRTDAYRDWGPDVAYWFGENSASVKWKWITSNAPLNHGLHYRANY